jgi:hypothetical protein
MNNSTRERGSSLGSFPGQRTPGLDDWAVEVLRARHYSCPTEEAYAHWIRRFTLFHRSAHPRGSAEGHATLLTHLAVKENVAASTRKQASASLPLLYRHVLGEPLNRGEGVVRARKPKQLPVVLTSEAVEAVLAHVYGTPSSVCTLLYGSGLSLRGPRRLQFATVRSRGLWLKVKPLGRFAG